MTKRNAMQEWENKVKAAKEAHDEAAANLKQANEASEPVRRERGFNLVESQQIRTQIDICRARIDVLPTRESPRITTLCEGGCALSLICCI